MSKKLFKRLIKTASTPVPKEQDKQLQSGGYNERQTPKRKSPNTSEKRSDRSR